MTGPNPHDVFFVAIFGASHVAADAQTGVLPPAVATAIDWSLLERVSTAFVDGEVEHRIIDRIPPPVREAVMTTVEKLREESRRIGREEGRELGELRGTARTLLRLSKRKFGGVDERVRARSKRRTTTASPGGPTVSSSPSISKTSFGRHPAGERHPASIALRL